MIYRRADSNDLSALVELGLTSYSRLKKILTPVNWAKMESVLTSEQTFPNLVQRGYAFVCEEDGPLLGMAFLLPRGNPTDIYSAETSYIRMVGVRPQANGKGIAQTLIRLCIDQAKETGERLISLHSAEIMYAARHVYEKLGFRKIRLLDEHYGLKYWLYEMDISSS